jgi:hypothetical protein
MNPAASAGMVCLGSWGPYLPGRVLEQGCHAEVEVERQRGGRGGRGP